MASTPEPTPRKTWAERSLSFLDSHPLLKLAALLWAGLAPVVGLGYSLYRTHVEERREGWLDAPKVEMSFARRSVHWAPPQIPSCTFVNVGPRPLAAVSMRFRIYAVDLKDPCRVARSAPYGGGVSQDELGPNKSMTADFPMKGFDFHCRNWSPGTRVCKECLIVAECQVQFHRVPGLDRYQRSRYAFAEPGCTGIDGVENKVFYQGPNSRTFTWPEERDKRAYSCFVAGKDRPLDRADDEIPPEEDVEKLLANPK